MEDPQVNNIESAQEIYVPDDEQREERRAALSDSDVQTRWALYHDEKHSAPVLARFVSPSETALTTDFAAFIGPARGAVVRKASETEDRPIWLGEWLIGVDIVAVIDYDVNATVPLNEDDLSSMYSMDAETLKRDFERVSGTVREAPHAPDHLQQQWPNLVTAVREFSAAFNKYFTRTTVRNIGMTVVLYGHEFDTVYTQKLTASLRNVYHSNQDRRSDIESLVLDTLLNEDLPPYPMYSFLSFFAEDIAPRTRHPPAAIDALVKRHQTLIQSQLYQNKLSEEQQRDYQNSIDGVRQPTDEQDDQDTAPDG